jgi:hypothetical protein
VFKGFALVVGHSFTLFLGYFMGLLDSYFFQWDNLGIISSFVVIPLDMSKNKWDEIYSEI